MRIIPFILCLILTFYNLSLLSGQRDPALVVTHFERKKEGFFYLADSIIASELASFNFAGPVYRQKPSEPLIPFTVENVRASSVRFELDNHSVFIETGRFRPGSHRLQYFQRSGYLLKIDGRYFWGIDGKVPQRRINALQVVIDGNAARIPVSAYNDLFEPNLCIRMFISGRLECEAAVFASHDGERVYIYMRNGTIPNLYEVTWVFRNGKYVGRVIDFAY
ncbi:MAG: hypothetical protein EA361_01290 [Bacteroidetes bacterium]|nr:MAG: hypothetical protein EA361_01290 [Bacteroidota bacterium]